MKKCPYCAEDIQDDAIKCRHCGTALISPDIRALAARWSKLRQGERDHEWSGLNERRQRELTLALAELAAPPAALPPPPAIVAVPVKRKTSAAAWGCLILIVGFVLFAVLIPNLQDALERANVKAGNSATEESKGGRRQSWKPPANDVPEHLAADQVSRGGDGKPTAEMLRLTRQLIESQGLWCGRISTMILDPFKSSANRNVFHVACDNGKEAVNYEVVANRDFIVQSVREK